MRRTAITKAYSTDMDGNERRPPSDFALAGFVLAALVAVMCFVLLPIFDCAACENRGAKSCPYCKGSGKWSLMERVRAPTYSDRQ